MQLNHRLSDFTISTEVIYYIWIATFYLWCIGTRNSLQKFGDILWVLQHFSANKKLTVMIYTHVEQR
jgi:hypothetical protein